MIGGVEWQVKPWVEFSAMSREMTLLAAMTDGSSIANGTK